MGGIVSLGMDSISQRDHPFGQLGQDVFRGFIDQRMHRVQPQGIDVELLQPPKGVVTVGIANARRVFVVQVDRVTPMAWCDGWGSRARRPGRRCRPGRSSRRPRPGRPPASCHARRPRTVAARPGHRRLFARPVPVAPDVLGDAVYPVWLPSAAGIGTRRVAVHRQQVLGSDG